MSDSEQYAYIDAGMTDAAGDLLPSALAALLMERAGEYAAVSGLGRDALSRKGLGPVIVRWHADISRLPKSEETVGISHRPGRPCFALFPHFFTVTDGAGAEIITASAVFSIIDLKTRSIVSPAERGIRLSESVEYATLPFPRRSFCPSAAPSGTFTVPEGFIDSNGHMNNRHYLELAESSVTPPADRQLRSFDCEYALELMAGQTVNFSAGSEGNSLFFSMDGERHHFHALFKYE